MNEVQAVLFGRFHLVAGANEIIEIEARKAQELLCYLLVFRHRPHSRDIIADILWTDNPSEQSRSYLRRTLWQLQNTFERHAGNLDHPLLLVEQDWLQVNPLASIRIDVAAFEKSYARVRGVPGEGLNKETAALLRSATELYRGHLLEGWYQDWCLLERERLQHIYLVMLDKLMRYCEAHRLFEEGVDYGNAILREDRAREYTHRQMMRLYYLAHDGSAALHQYQRCVAALREELGVEPTNRTRRLYEQIKADLHNPSVEPSPVAGAAPLPGNATLGELLHSLQQARADVTKIGDLLEQQIETVRKLQSP